MPLPTIANVCRVSLEWNGGLTANVFHVRRSSIVAADVADDLDDAMNNDVWGDLSSTWQVSTIKVQKLDGSSGAVVQAPATPAKWTGNTGGQYDPASCMELLFHTGLSGRRYQ